ncbi:MAG: prepilin-type N-terminal cleavage/methylation domain-containing protein [Ruminiclostridium sp.]|nr:prepilin-type N-terminal cleavage/methylation domain-containing protein [Ruminiclostridium sp.]
MKNLFRRLNGRKGFTLVECLIAIAVFAALTMLVFAILTNARNAAVRTNETEENLTTLIENVVADESYTRYKAGSEYLTLKLSSGGDDFRVTYTEIDGYKTFVVCPNTACQYFADNDEFMTCERMDFVQTTHYTCPKCASSFVQQLVCEDCGNTASHTATSNFTYISSTGGFYCNACGGTGVRGSNVDDNVVSDDNLNIKTLVPNAIVYGSVDKFDDRNDIFDLQDSAGGTISGDISMTLSYTEGANSSIPGTYKIRLNSNAGASDFKILVDLPAGYKIPANSFSANLGNCNPQYDATTNAYYLEFYDCTTNGFCEAEFQLVNEKSGLSFELDYYNPSDTANSGLSGYWFQMTSANDTYTS